MKELFPVMLQALTTASEKIGDYLANCFNDIPSPLTEEKKASLWMQCHFSGIV